MEEDEKNSIKEEINDDLLFVPEQITIKEEELIINDFEDIKPFTKPQVDTGEPSLSQTFNYESYETIFPAQPLQKKLHNNEAAPYNCTKCNKYFVYLKTFQSHKVKCKKSLPVAVYKCNYCDNTFSKLGEFIRHGKIHTEVPQHQCQLCKRNFDGFIALKTHYQSHRMVKPGKCVYCERNFKTEVGLRKHQRRHEELLKYKCNVCNKRFYDLDTLKIHQFNHTGGGRYFNCEQCDMNFNEKYELSIHELHEHKRMLFKFVNDQ